MKRHISIILAVTALVVLGAAPSRGARPVGAQPPSRPGAIGVQTIASGLHWPAAFTFAPDGKIFYGERFTGWIRIYDPATGSDTPFFQIPHISTIGEQGLLGLALHPGYPGVPGVYAYATTDINGQLRNRIFRIRDNGGVGSNPKVIFSSDTTAGQYHDGGRILFGPDGALYAVVGEGHDSSNAQDLTNYAGKVLRMTPAGKVPPDNPFPGSLIYTYGLRNSFGFTFDSQTGLLWETENGPECNDEINIEQSGENHAWGPSETCSTPPDPPANTNQDGPEPRIFPLTWFTPTIAPTGTAFCEGCGLTGADGTLFFGTYNTWEVRQAILTPDRMGIQSVSTVYTHTRFVVSMEVGTDGAIYFSDPTGIFKLVQV